LVEADLTGADLSYSRLAGADLTDADVTDVDLTGVDLSLRHAILTDADLATAWGTRIRWPKGFHVEHPTEG
jgi:uncharacterized protein YjbI with pentapeptide repeats